MADYISRDDVLRKFIEGDGDDEFTEGYNFAVNEHREKIKAMSATTDVQPVKHGRWIGEEVIQCSNCNFTLNGTSYGHIVHKYFSYCPNCGARMDGDTN